MSRGRKSRYHEYEELVKSLNKIEHDRPKYINGIGVFVGKQSISAWIKIKLTHSTIYKGKSRALGSYIEIKLGELSSFTWEQLEELKRSYQGKIDRQEPLEEQTIPTFREYTDIYLNRVNLVKQGRKNTEIALDRYLIPEFGNKAINTITAHQVDIWQSRRLKQVKPATVKRQKVILNAILNMALKDELISNNPVAKSQSIKIPDRQPRCLTKNELSVLIDKSSNVNEWLSNFILFGVSTGLRKGEMLSLKWKNVIQKESGEIYLQFNSGKTGKLRIVPCTKVVVDVLNKQRFNVGARENIFPYSVSTIDRAWIALKHISRIDDIRIQDLRVTCASYSANAGVPIKTLAAIMGHSTTRMLEKHYVGLSESEIMRASKVIEDSLNGI